MLMPWTTRIATRNAGKEANTPWWVNDKYLLHKFCQEQGLPRPEVYAFWKTPGEMDLDVAPQKFVLKPTVMFSNWGVMLLEKRDDGTFFEELTRRTLTLEQIQAEQLAAYERCQYKGSYRLMIEEKVQSHDPGLRVPLDYKIFTFYDEPRMVQQVNRNLDVLEFAFFDAKFQPLDLDRRIISDWSTCHQGEHDRPDDHEEMLEIASRLTAALRTPFMRVDMFAGTRGPVIGELTPSPGDAFYGNNYKYSELHDAEFGQAWVEAERRIAASQGQVRAT